MNNSPYGKIFGRINERLALKGNPYTPQEIDEHECAERIWATIAQCKQEFDEAVDLSWKNGYEYGKDEYKGY